MISTHRYRKPLRPRRLLRESGYAVIEVTITAATEPNTVRNTLTLNALKNELPLSTYW